MRELNAQEATGVPRGRADTSPHETSSHGGGSRCEHQTDERPRRRKRPRFRQEQCYIHEPWSPQHALEYYRKMSDFFDSTKFIPDDPITFEDIPWPVLLKPGTYGPEDISWSAVEAFFSCCKSDDASADYKKLVEKSHRRFHPDRWRARNVFAGLEDATRTVLEGAVNVVAQALTPIWRELKGLSRDV